MIDLQHCQKNLRQWILANCAGDPAHDLQHIERVVANATSIARDEQADLNILLPAAWLHDCIHVAKDSPDRAKASLFAADQAVSLLREEARTCEGAGETRPATVSSSTTLRQKISRRKIGDRNFRPPLIHSASNVSLDSSNPR